jgi:hypothetical protein
MMTAPALHPILAAEQAAKAKGPKQYAQWCQMMGTILHEACHCVVMLGHTTDDDWITEFGRYKGGGGYMRTGQLDNPLLESEITLAGVAYEELLLDAAGVTDADARAEHLNRYAGGDLALADRFLTEWADWVKNKYRIQNCLARHFYQKDTLFPRVETMAMLKAYLEAHWAAVEYVAEYMLRHWGRRHRPTRAWSIKARMVIKDAGYRKKNAGWAHTAPPMEFLSLIFGNVGRDII